jgi:hypothetical protein
MSTLLDTATQTTILQRLDKLQTNNQRVWGSLTVDQMLPHISGLLALAMGDVQMTIKTNFFKKHILKRLLFLKGEMPRGVKTPARFKDVDPNITNEQLLPMKTKFKEQLQRFLAAGEADLHAHPIFGQLSKKDWGKIIYMHTDHHLRQFGA